MKTFVSIFFVFTLYAVEVSAIAVKDELRPGYGIKYSHVGKLIQGLSRYDLVVGVELPENWNDLTKIGTLLPKSFKSFCERIDNITTAHEVCLEILPVLDEYVVQEKRYQEEIFQKLEYDLVAILPDLDQRNHLSKATQGDAQSEYHFPIENQKPYKWKYPKEKVSLPKKADKDKPGLTDVQAQVSDQLGDVYKLLDGIERRMNQEQTQEREEERRTVEQNQKEQERLQDMRNAYFGGNFRGRKKRSTDGSSDKRGKEPPDIPTEYPTPEPTTMQQPLTTCEVVTTARLAEFFKNTDMSDITDIPPEELATRVLKENNLTTISNPVTTPTTFTEELTTKTTTTEEHNFHNITTTLAPMLTTCVVVTQEAVTTSTYSNPAHTPTTPVPYTNSDTETHTQRLRTQINGTCGSCIRWVRRFINRTARRVGQYDYSDEGTMDLLDRDTESVQNLSCSMCRQRDQDKLDQRKTLFLSRMMNFVERKLRQVRERTSLSITETETEEETLLSCPQCLQNWTNRAQILQQALQEWNTTGEPMISQDILSKNLRFVQNGPDCDCSDEQMTDFEERFQNTETEIMDLFHDIKEKVRQNFDHTTESKYRHIFEAELNHWVSTKFLLPMEERQTMKNISWQQLVENGTLSSARTGECAQCLDRFRSKLYTIMRKTNNSEIENEDHPLIKRLRNQNCRQCPQTIASRTQYMFDKVLRYVNETRQRARSRQKRGVMENLAMKAATSFAESITIGNVAGLAVDGIGTFINWQKDKAIKKGIETLTARQYQLKDKVVQVDNDLLSVAKTTSRAIKDIWDKMVKQNAKIALLSMQLNQVRQEFDTFDERLEDHDQALKLLAWAFGTLQSMLQRNLDHYEQLLSKAEILFNALDSLSTGRLNHHVISASNLTCYLKHIEEVIKIDYPNYELAMKNINQYYDMNLVSFIVKDAVLYIHIPVFLKLREQPMLDLFRVSATPIPYDPAEMTPSQTGEWIGQYTKVNLEKEYLAMGKEIYLTFEQNELDNCKKLAGTYFCENLLLMKHISQHTCASAIYHNRTDLVPQICSIDYMEGYRPKPELLEGTEYLILIGMPKPWNLYCNKALDIPVQLKESPLAIIRRKDLCHCAFSAGPYYIHENLLKCEDEHHKLASQVSLFYTINTATADFFQKTMKDIQKNKDRVMIELEEQVSSVIMNFEEVKKTKTKSIQLSGNVITDQQIDLDSPEWKFLENNAEFQSLKREQAAMVKDLGRMVRQAEEGNVKLKQPFANEAEFQKAMSKIDNWIKTEGFWTYLLLGLSIAGTIALACSMCLCKYLRSLKDKQTTMRTEMRRMNDGINNPGFDPKVMTASLLAMSNLAETQAMEVILTKSNNDSMILYLFMGILDVIYLILMHAGIMIILYVSFKVACWIMRLTQTEYLNPRRRSNSLLGWFLTDQCDLYLQLTAQNGPALKCYMGTLNGPPSELTLHDLPTDISLRKGWLCDKLEIDWKHSPSATYEGERFYFPTKYIVALSHKLLARQVFRKKEHLALKIIMIYGGRLVVKNWNQVSRAELTTVESGLATTCKPKASTSEEGGEKGGKLDRNQDARKSAKLIKVKCIHCNEDTYAKETKVTRF